MLFFIHQQSSSKNEKKYIRLFIKIAKEIDCKDYKIILVQNGMEKRNDPAANEKRECCKIISDNKYREFSAWERGIKYVREDLNCIDFDLIITNETILTHRNFDEKLLKAFLKTISKVFDAQMPLIGGEKNRIPCSPSFFNSNYPFYISTYFLICNSSAQKLIKTFIPNGNFLENFNKSFTSCNGSVISEKSLLKDTKYKIFLDQWLYRDGGKYKWYGFQCLSKSNFQMMRLKLISIIIEHNISQNLIKRKVAIIDVNNFIDKSLFGHILFFIKKIWHRCIFYDL